MDLEIQDLSVARGGVPLVAGLSIVVRPGHALILRGPNGCGKTTLLRCLVGLQPALSGQITGGEDRLAYAGHADGLKAMLSVRENLDLWAAVYRQTDRVDAALDAFALQDLETRLAGQLSAGQKRRLGLARLLVTGRPVWVMDEPTVSLDAASIALFAKAVAAHLASGGSAILATHIDLGFVADTLDLAQWAVRDKTALPASDEAFL